MKKTLIALLALGGLAMAETYDGTFAWNADTTPTLTFADDSGLTATITGMTIAQPGGTSSAVDFATADPKATSVYAGTLTPGTNVGNGGSWSIDFSIANTTDSALTLGFITFNAFAYNNGGTAQNADTYQRDINFKLTTGGVTSTVVHSFTNTNSVYNWDTNPTFVFETPLEVAAGESVSFKLGVSEAASEGCFIGLSGVTVPEPATATLSLLALAGLAARRRRK